MFPMAAVTSYHELVALNNRNLLSYSSEGQKSEIKVQRWLIPSRGSEGKSVPCLSLLASGGCWQFLAFLDLQMHHSNFCLRLHMAFPCLSLCVLLSSHKDTSHWI